jgi:superfamily II DNA/RNA helicase
MPEELDIYTHRSGRTGRAGKKGTSIIIINSREKGKIHQIEKTTEQKIRLFPKFQPGKQFAKNNYCMLLIVWKKLKSIIRKSILFYRIFLRSLNGSTAKS